MRRKLALARRVIAAVLSLALVSSSVLGNVSVAIGAAGSPSGAEAPITKEPAPTVVRELADERTETSKSLLLSNGNIRTQVYGVPQFFRDDKSGDMLPVDASLKRATFDGRAVSTNGPNSFELTLPDKLTGDWVSIETSRVALFLRPTSLTRSDAAPVTKTLTTARSATATGVVYTDAFQGASLEYESRADGLKETIVVSEPTSDTAFGFDLKIEGATPRLEEDGSVSITPSGESSPSMSIPRPFMFDARESSDGLGYSDKVHYEISGEAPVWKLAVVADAGWMNDPARVWPVRIDPTVVTTSGQPAADTYVRSDNQTTNYSGATGLWVNNHHQTYDYIMYSLLQPGSTFTGDLASKAASGYKVVAARMSMKVLSVNTAGTIRGSRATSSVNITTVTWATKPSGSTPFTDSQASANPESTNTFDMTDMTKYWQDNGVGATSATVIFQTLTSGARLSYKSNENTGTKPLYAIDYAPVPTVSMTSPSTGGVNSVPQATWTFTEALSNPQAEYQIEVATSTAGPAIATSDVNSSSTSVSLPVPAGGFQAGTKYYARVRAASSPSSQTPRLWSAWSSWKDFTLLEQIGDLGAATASSQNWFTETDTDGDGLTDNHNDANTSGRGSAGLSWSQVPGANGYDVYLFDGDVFRNVEHLASGETTTWTTSGSGLYPTDTWIEQNAASLASGANPYASGTLDLRDDPRPLYRETPGTAYDEIPSYLFKVVPTSANDGAMPLSQAETLTVGLDNRTIGVNDDPRHATYDMGNLAEHDAEFVADTETLRLSVTDLSIASWGPEARISRAYGSSVTTEGLFGPSWRFNFEQRVTTDTAGATWTDEIGDEHTFVLRDSEYHAPRGLAAELEREFVGGELGWRLNLHGGESMLFDSAGVLVQESDRNGNAVSYDRTTEDELSIWAANGQRIVVDLSGGIVNSATYGTADGTRTVEYSGLTEQQGQTSAFNVCTYYPGTEDERTVRYDYGSTFQQGVYYLSELQVEEISNADWTFEAWPTLTEWTRDGLGGGLIDDGNIQRQSAVCPEDWQGVLEGAVFQDIETNPTGTLARISSRYAMDDPVRWTSYDYSPMGEAVAETDPLGNTKRSTHDSRGNMLASTDEEGNETTYAYGTSGGERDQIVLETDARGARTMRSYDASGNLTLESREVRSGVFAQAQWDYDDLGRGLVATEDRAIDDEESVTTTFDEYALSGEPKEISHPDVKLSVSGQPTTLTESKTYDEFGNITHSEAAIDAESADATNTYSIAGYLESSEDASGTQTVYETDALGRNVEQYRTDGESVIEKVTYELSPQGVVSRENHYDGANIAFRITNAIDALGYNHEADHSIEGKTTYWVDARGNTVREWSPNADTSDQTEATRTTYDGADRAVQLLAPGRTQSEATLNTFSPSGNLIRTEEDGSWTDYGYDAAGNRVRETRPHEEGGEVADVTDYDLAGNVTRSVKAHGTEEEAATEFTYDLLGRQTSSALGEPSTRTYNKLGWVLAETDFDGIETTRVYDEAGRVMSETVAGKTTGTDYDGNGRVTQQTDPQGRRVGYTYDAFGRAVGEEHAAGAGEPGKTVLTSYDGLSRAVATTQTLDGAPTDVVSGFEYAAGSTRVSTQTAEYGEIENTVTYDEQGREDARTLLAAGDAVSRTVTSRNLESQPLAWSTDGRTSSATYDAQGRYLTQDGSGWAAAGAEYTYDEETGRKTSDYVALAYPSQSYSTTYAYTEAGRISRVVSGSTTWDYGFDERGNLTNASVSGGDSASFVYAPVTDRLLNRKVGASVATTYTYDSLGRREAQGPTSDPDETTFGYDDASRLTSWAKGTAGATY
ncbi:MAG: RHS repeat protein, partial [Coriobacteriales bacterium]|nr:RHS repeat protein [Coriobacteriales bacterium]